MGSLIRISKSLAALLTSNVVNLVTRLLLPPLFLYRYGTTLYGEWLALSGAVAYLSTLNFGIQTYSTQALTIRYQQNDLPQYHLQQSTSLRVLLGILGTAALIALAIFVIPMQRWLHLTIPQSTASFTLYLLALQVLIVVLFGYFTGIYTVLSRAHTGVLWVNGQRLAMVLLTSYGVWRHWSFPILAACQLATYLVGIGMILWHVRRVAPEIFPQLHGWDRSVVRGILAPSGYFGLISWSTFLSYEIPVLVLQREVGPFVVVAFTVMRTIFSMVRQALNAVTQSLAPEITRLFGREDWAMLAQIYAYSERLIYALAPTANLALLVLSPVLLQLWLHQPQLYSVAPYVCMAAIAIVLATKEQKFQFQYATNTHESMARMMFGSYVALAALSVPMVHWLGILGFLAAWFVVEVYQVTRMLHLNQALFAHTGLPSRAHPTQRLLMLSGFGLVATGFLLHQTWQSSRLVQVGASAAVFVSIGTISFWMFDLLPMVRKFYARVQNVRGWAKRINGKQTG